MSCWSQNTTTRYEELESVGTRELMNIHRSLSKTTTMIPTLKNSSTPCSKFWLSRHGRRNRRKKDKEETNQANFEAHREGTQVAKANTKYAIYRERGFTR